jgi:methylamine--corrinoid protein Co-methyltransferase
MIDFLEICHRALSGPLVSEEKFDMERLYPAITKLAKKYGIQYDPENPVSQDDALADAVFHAAVDLLAEVGVYCLGTQRIIEFTAEEIKQAVRQAPGPCWFGEGHERKLFKPRKPDDPQPSWCHVGSGVANSSEEIYFRTVEGYARIDEADSIAAPCLSELRKIPVMGGSPVEILASIRANLLARQALQQCGRPGLPILNLIATAASAIGTIAASQPRFGARSSDGWIIGFLPELKVDYGALNKVAYLLSWDASVGAESSPILGGYCGGPVGVAIVNTAYIIAGILVMKGSYQLTFPMDINLSCSTTRRVLWSVGVSSQAISRNISFPLLSLAYVAGGPMTESYFYEATAYLLTAISSGSSAQTPIPAKALKLDHQTPLEMKFSAEVIRAAPQIKRGEANEIVKRLLEKYEENLPTAPEGKRYQDCFDVATGFPKPEYVELYKKMKREIFELGVPLNL